MIIFLRKPSNADVIRHLLHFKDHVMADLSAVKNALADQSSKLVKLSGDNRVLVNLVGQLGAQITTLQNQIATTTVAATPADLQAMLTTIEQANAAIDAVDAADVAAVPAPVEAPAPAPAPVEAPAPAPVEAPAPAPVEAPAPAPAPVEAPAPTDAPAAPAA